MAQTLSDIFEKTIFSLVIIVIGFYCAGQVPPSGGPPDTTPPIIVSTYPKEKETRFSDKKFLFSFNKYIDRRSFQESFFISPPLSGLNYEWDGKDVEIGFNDSLQENTTYIITIGSDVKDTRNNRLAQSFSLPFSTGDNIDSGLISGVVLDEKNEGIMVYAYPIDEKSQDTLNPFKTKPKYLTQTGVDGSFIIPYLAFGTYRVIAVRDQYKNLLYEPQVDSYGVLNYDIDINSSNPSCTNLQFLMSIEDTARPFLSSARAIDNVHVMLRFSEPIDIESFELDSISIIDTLSLEKLKVIDISFTEKTYNEAQIVTNHQIIGRTYRIRMNGCKDFSGNDINPSLNFADFIAGIEPDTTIPKFEILNLRNNATNIAVDESVHIDLSEAIQRKPFEGGFILLDSSENKIEGTYKWISSAEVYFIPYRDLSFGMSYTITIYLDSLKDFVGNASKDSVFKITFRTIEEKFISEISGKVIDETKNCTGNINILAKNIVKKNFKPRIQNVDSLGNFRFTNLEEGKYLLTAYCDKDKNGVYSFGKPFPFIKAERFAIYPDTLKLRARWPLEGIIIHLK